MGTRPGTAVRVSNPLVQKPSSRKPVGGAPRPLFTKVPAELAMPPSRTGNTASKKIDALVPHSARASLAEGPKQRC